MMKAEIDDEELKYILFCYLKDKGLHGKQEVHYDWRVIGWFEGDVVTPMCLLCETKESIVCRAYWIYEEKERLMVILYFLCDDCGRELKVQNEVERDSIVSKVIEPKITMCLKTGTYVVREAL